MSFETIDEHVYDEAYAADAAFTLLKRLECTRERVVGIHLMHTMDGGFPLSPEPLSKIDADLDQAEVEFKRLTS